MQRTSWWQERITGGAGGVLGVPAPRQPLARRRWPRTRSSRGLRGRRRRRAAAARLRGGGRPGGRRGQGLPLELPAGPRAGAERWWSTPGAAGSWTTAGGAMVGGRGPAGSRRKWTAADHLLVGTSLPWLLPRALHDLESWDEALCAGARGERMAASARRCARRPISSTGRRSGRPSTGSPACCKGRRADVHLRRSACCPATCTTSTWPRPVAGACGQQGLPDRRLAAAPHGAAEPAHRLPAGLEPAAGEADHGARPVGRTCRRCR